MIKFLYYSIFYILYSHSRASRKPTGYALLLSILVLSTMLTIGLTVTTVITTQVRLTRRVFDTMKALAAADSGIEGGLYEDLKDPAPSFPVNKSSPSYNVTKEGGILDPDLVAAYAFDEGSGSTTIADVTGNHDGTVNGGAFVASQAGHINALEFDDSPTDGASVPSFTMPSTGTVEFWLKSNTATWNADGQPISNGGTAFWIHSKKDQGGGRDVELFDTDPTAPHLYNVPDTTTLTNWHHYAWTLDNSTSIFYVDGVALSTKSCNAPCVNFTWGTGGGQLYIGWDSANRHFDGAIDDLRIWSSVRDQTQITLDMNTAVTAVSGTTTLKSVGSYGKAQRSVEVTY